MTADAFRQQLEAIRAEYRRGLPAKLSSIESLWNDLAGGMTKPAAFVDLLRELHTLAGSAKTLGVPGVSEAAAAAESFLKPISRRSKPLDDAQRAEVTRLLEALRRAAGTSAA